MPIMRRGLRLDSQHPPEQDRGKHDRDEVGGAEPAGIGLAHVDQVVDGVERVLKERHRQDRDAPAGAPDGHEEGGPERQVPGCEVAQVMVVADAVGTDLVMEEPRREPEQGAGEHLDRGEHDEESSHRLVVSERMGDPLDRRDELERALELAAAEARAYLEGLARDPVQPAGSAALLEEGAGGGVQGRGAPLGGELPQHGDGALTAVTELARLAREAATRSSGPRFFHFVIGGTTPAALAADWLTSALDQNVAAWVASPFGTRIEQVAIDWLRQLFRLPPEFAGVLVTGGTMANFTCLAAAREWCAEQAGFDAAEEGLSGAPQIPVLSSGYVHASAMKSLALLGVGRANVHKLSRDARGRIDLGALADRLASLDGGPAIVIANAGEVNAGDFDPIEEMAELADRHGAWLHVDGAFGLFARLSPRTEALTAGAERASSVSSDGHKWLNVPHDCGFAFVRGRLRSGPRCGRTGRRATARWWSATWTWRGTW